MTAAQELLLHLRDAKGNIRCTVCQRDIPRGWVTSVCSEQLRRRQKIEA